MVVNSIEPLRLLRRLYILVVNAAIALLHVLEPGMIGPGLLSKYFIESGNERRRGPVGGVQRKCFRVVAAGYYALRIKVRRNVRTPEGIDRLLGITDDEQRSMLRLWPVFDFVHRTRKDASEDIPLRLVGILEFIHKRDTIFTAYCREQGARLVRLLLLSLFDNDLVGAPHKIVKRHRRISLLILLKQSLGYWTQHINQNRLAITFLLHKFGQRVRTLEPLFNLGYKSIGRQPGLRHQLNELRSLLFPVLLRMQRFQHRLMDQGFIRCTYFHLHRDTVLEGVFRQETATEGMDRADRYFVKISRQAFGLLEDVTNAVLELTGRLLRVRHEQQVLHALYLLFHQQLEDDAL